MNLVDGKILSAKECDTVLETLESRILKTLAKCRLYPETVISACDRLVKNLNTTMFSQALAEFGIDESLCENYIKEAKRMFCAESLRYRLETELGTNYLKYRAYIPPFEEHAATERIFPLGVLLHVAAGNADGLPAFSVLEGLLTGNINILKLPAAEGGVSVRILLELIKAEPALAEYIYVFDYSSKDIVHVKKLVSAADAVVVWGGREAVSALRTLVPPHIKLIEWGHKISFGYVTEEGITDEGLRGFAENIAETGQILCSSLQGIFVDTDDMDCVYDFCRRFLPVLEDVIEKSGKIINYGIKAQTALRLYNEELEEAYKGSRVFKGINCSLVAYPDKTLDTSIQFGNAWVRPLLKAEIMSILRPYKNFLQTAGLLCGDAEHEEISELLFRAGIVHISRGEKMSRTYCGKPHDGEYPLRRYCRIVTDERKIQ